MKEVEFQLGFHRSAGPVHVVAEVIDWQHPLIYQWCDGESVLVTDYSRRVPATVRLSRTSARAMRQAGLHVRRNRIDHLADNHPILRGPTEVQAATP